MANSYMIIGILSLELTIAQANSLKDKRQVIKSLLEHIRNKFNVSAAEVDFLDTWRKSGLGFAVVSNEQSFANSVLNKVLEHVESDPRVSVDRAEMEFV
jgi:hypothetical protein